MPNSIQTHVKKTACLAAGLMAWACWPAGAAPWAVSGRVDAVIVQAIEEGTIPGAVVTVGREGEVVHHRAYGHRALLPNQEEMTRDTIFDIASLTKVVATVPAIMLLVEEGKLRLADPVTAYLPEFQGGESNIRVVDLLTHFSGLRPDLDLEPPWQGYEEGIRRAFEEKPQHDPATQFVYSDVNFILLAELIRKLSGESLITFAATRIFRPLGMKETTFRPPEGLRRRIAPTERLPDGTILRGTVHDPSTRFMGGVSGHAGLFSTGEDLARFAQMMLNRGRLKGIRALSPLSVLKMTTSHSPAGQPAQRGLGWDLDSPYSSPRGDLFPVGSYGHTGFTGTSMWIDPGSQSYVILLTNRVHLEPRGSIVSLRARLANVVAASVEKTGPVERRAESPPSPVRPAAAGEVLTGLDVLARDGFAPLRGKRVGLITNHTGRDRAGQRGIDLLAGAEDVELAAIFSPEHGLAGDQEQEGISDGRDAATGVPVFSLYRREQRRPTREQLVGIDVLVFDIQDAGARFYTYATTMAYAMEAAADAGVDFMVLDRPNPLNGVTVEGPMLDADLRSFTGYFPMPVRHGMTLGELAVMWNHDNDIGVDLEVITMEGWRREMWFDETGLTWVNPSPNLRTLEQATVYPGLAMLEGLPNLSVGRGTDSPFLFVGADWIDGSELSRKLKDRGIPGVRFYPAERQPSSSRFEGLRIEGVHILVEDRERFRPTQLGLELAVALQEVSEEPLRWEETARLLGNSAALAAIQRGEQARTIWQGWRREASGFLRQRSTFLLYPRG